MQKKYVVRLTDSERDLLSCLVKKQRVSAQKVLRARSAQDRCGWTSLDRCGECERLRLSHENHRKHSGAVCDGRV
jgi:hypothetical protein